MNPTSCIATLSSPGEGRRLNIMGLEVTVKVSSATTGGNYYVFEAVVQPGAGVPRHVHQREDEILQVLAGELEVSLGGESSIAPAGAVAFFPRDVPHGFGNAGGSPARCRFVVSPGENFEQFFEELNALPVDPPPDMAVVSEIFDRYGLPLAREAVA